MSDTPQPIDDHSVGLLNDEVREDDSLVVLADRPLAGSAGSAGAKPPSGTFRGTITGMLTMIMMIAATYVIPQLHWARPWTSADPVPFWNLLGREFLGQGEQAAADDAATRELAALALAEADGDNGDDGDSDRPFAEPDARPSGPEDIVVPAYEERPEDRDEEGAPPIQEIENPERLGRFFAALTRTDLRLPGAITRASHFGDSAVGNDGITGAIRAKLQARFGDAGHGFHLLGQPNASYRHVGVKVTEKSPWHNCFIIQGCRSDGHYGFGGTSFESTAGAEIRIGTAKKGSMGRRVSRFEVYYAGTPRGGNLRLQVDDEDPIKVVTLADELEDRWHTVEVEDGEHSLSIRAAGGGRVRAYGVTLERDGPGVVWDGLSQIGALTRRMLNWDTEHIRSQVAHRDPDLVVLMFGGNDMNMRGTMDNYKKELAQVIQLFNGEGVDRPPACLIMAPLDHGERSGQQILTRAIVPELVQAQREVAQEEGCAFFDTFMAMGGEGSMGRWSRSEPKLGSGDLAHLSYHGHKVIGSMVYRALLHGYRDFRGEVEGKPMRALTAIAEHGVTLETLDEVDLDALLGSEPATPEVADLPGGSLGEATAESATPGESGESGESGETAEPGGETAEPADETAEPADETAEPGGETAEPEVGDRPATGETNEPSDAG